MDMGPETHCNVRDEERYNMQILCVSDSFRFIVDIHDYCRRHRGKIDVEELFAVCEQLIYGYFVEESIVSLMIQSVRLLSNNDPETKRKLQSQIKEDDQMLRRAIVETPIYDFRCTDKSLFHEP